ncbi:hypothetical protein GJB61_07595 [Paenibacillus sp. LC-T2]|uniref:Uncharacterized protein n=1 Tax=Paenibacillus monticola TaxID=2666075 RepID=A0A7X2H3F4_9BACL|nr:hypothetical protein [Paenibacillus monticola]
MDKRGKADGIRAFSLHPGSIVETGLSRFASKEQLQAIGVIDKDGKPILDPSKNLKTVEQGASTSVWCAISPQLDGMGASIARTTTSPRWWRMRLNGTMIRFAELDHWRLGSCLMQSILKLLIASGA